MIDEGGLGEAKRGGKGDAPGIDSVVHAKSRRALRAGDVGSVKIERGVSRRRPAASGEAARGAIPPAAKTVGGASPSRPTAPKRNAKNLFSTASSSLSPLRRNVAAAPRKTSPLSAQRARAGLFSRRGDSSLAESEPMG